MYKGIEILEAGYSSVAWDVKFQVFPPPGEKEGKLKTYAVRYNGNEGYVISESKNGEDFTEIRNPAEPRHVAYILPKNHNWEYSEFKAMIVGFSAGFGRGYNEGIKIKP